MTYRLSRLSHATQALHAMQALPVAAVMLALAACGSVDGGSATSASAMSTAGDKASVQASVQSLSMTLTSPAVALPQFHIAPVVLEQPADTDVFEPAASALDEPHVQAVSAALAQLSTRRLTKAAMESVLRDGIVPDEFAADAPGATPLASGTAVATYTPAQIRAAYGLPPLPAAGATPSSQQAAQLGAGQTIYIIDAQDDPNAAAELATFDRQFGLPGCSVSSIAASAALPLPPAASSGCSFSVVHSTSTGGMTSSAPGYDSGWATEIALDVQWTHATAPLARIILIEAPDSSVNSLLAAVSLANAMGPGVVSMSFGSTEGSWTASVDSTFNNSAMTYVAAAGDSGAGVNWPAVSAHVLAVGGSTLTYTGAAPRSEIVWSGTGGGISQYTPTPSYQNSTVPDMGTPAHRSVSDVTFNADPTTGQYIAVLAPGATTATWLSAGGTSLSTPQWAGILAVADALSANAAQPLLGDPHAKIYGLSSQGASYASAFYDITRGSDGSCAGCFAEIGYDQPTGIGTPNVTSLLSALVAAPGGSAPPVSTPPVSSASKPPLVAGASLSGSVGTALLYPVSVTDSNPVTFTLSGAPSGMTISAAGVLSWPAPVIGTWSVTVTARDTRTALTGHGVLEITIAAAKAPSATAAGPVITASALNGVAGKPLSGTISFADKTSNTLNITISGVPAGITFTPNGNSLTLRWASPVAGGYKISVSAKDGNGLTASLTVPITITAH